MRKENGVEGVFQVRVGVGVGVIFEGLWCGSGFCSMYLSQVET